MPSNKKGKRGAKKYKAAANKNPEEHLQAIRQRTSVEVANAHAAKFQQATPIMDYDEYMDTLSEREQETLLSHYSKCSQHYNKGLNITNAASTVKGVSRFVFVADEMMNALDSAMKASNLFLTNTGGDHRRLLARICCTLAQVSRKQLMPLEHVAWGKAAVAVDPTYFNTHNQLSLGYQYAHEWQLALEAATKALALPESQVSWGLRNRLPMLKDIVNNNNKASIKLCLTDLRGIAIGHYREIG